MHKSLLVPVLYGEGQTQVLIVDNVRLPEPALKVWEVKTTIKDLTGKVCQEKFIFQGILHKQIVFVNKKTNLLQHCQKDVPFSGYMDVPCALPGMDYKFLHAVVEKECSSEQVLELPGHSFSKSEEVFEGEHLNGKFSVVHEKHVILIKVAVFQTEKVCLDPRS